jgi:threonylcarbamoyladenosine tRNA methylthiotransferase CDKAL1
MGKSNMKVFLKGLNSCTMRKQKLQQYRDFLIANGHEISDDPNNSDVTIMWTCAFRADVRDNSISEINRYQQEYGSELIVAGCLPDIAPSLLRENFSGRIINWRDDKERMEEIFGCAKLRFDQLPTVYVEEKLCDDAEKYRRENPDKDATFYDQFIKLVVSEGCQFQCAYCSERLAFPPFRSFPEDELVQACRRMVEETGQLEIILLADSLGNYGSDIGSSLPQLIRKLKTIHPDLKFALNNLNPASFIQYYDDMVEFLRNGDLLHLNLPIQSASARILKLMNREYKREYLILLLVFLGKPKRMLKKRFNLFCATSLAMYF